jgi:hypothetical protein
MSQWGMLVSLALRLLVKFLHAYVVGNISFLLSHSFDVSFVFLHSIRSAFELGHLSHPFDDVSFVFLNSIIIILGLDNMKQESSNFNIPNFAIHLCYKQWNVKGIRKIQDAQKLSQKVEFLKLCVKAHWMHIFDHSFFPHLKSNWNKKFHQPHMDVFYLS